MVQFVSPSDFGPLYISGSYLVDSTGAKCFPIVNSIPRFCASDNYASGFGLQWNKFSSTQLDTKYDGNLSSERFFAETAWEPHELSNCSVLEVGSGAGRFSEVFLRTTSGVLCSVDYSTAVDANWTNNKKYGDRLQLAQASIYELPFADNTFDKVFCLGVLQHTPSFADSVDALIRKTRAGGEIVVDFYPVNGWHTKLHSKYLLRPLTKHLPKPFLLKLIKRNIRWMLSLFDFLCRFRLGLFTRFIPITDVRGFPPGLSYSERIEWAVLDTFDAFSPQFDNPQRVQSVVSMFTKRDCQVTYAGVVRYPGGSSTVVRAVKN